MLPIRILSIAWAVAATAIVGCGPGASNPALAGSFASDSPTAGPTVRWVRSGPGERDMAVEVTGIDPGLLSTLVRSPLTEERGKALLRVQIAGPDEAEERTPLLGAYRVEGKTLRFQPRYPLEPGLRYRARFDPALLGASATTGPLTSRPIVAEFAVAPRPEQPVTRVVAVHPRATTVPENLLKFYLHFSRPMSRGDAYKYVRILNSKDEPIEKAFLELGEELWDPAGSRLTLLLDPGRVKRGLRPREELGPILVEGGTYTLQILRDWPDSEGIALQAPHRYQFRAGPPDDQPPDPASWKLDVPRAGTRDPLVLSFPEPLDHALLQRLIALKRPDGRAVAGAITVEAQDTRWRFQPERSWRAEEHQIRIDHDLEDLAGNSIGRPFEVDVFEPVRREVSAKWTSLKFRPR